MGSSLLSPLKSTLKHELEIDNTQWASVISMVWVVGTVSPFVAGLLIDTMGEPLAGALAITLILLGNGVCAIGVGSKKLSIFLIGRAIYSTGGGAVLLVGEVIMFKWFKGRQLPLAFGFAATISGLMSFSGPAAVTAILSKNGNITIPFWLATGLSAFGLLCFGAYALIHYSHYSRDVDVVNSEEEPSNCISHSSAEIAGKSKEDIVSDKGSAIAFSEKHPSATTTFVSSPGLSVDAIGGPFKRGWIKTRRLIDGLAALPGPYWQILLCISVQGTLFIPLHEVVPEMMETEWGYTRVESSRLFVYLHIIPIVLHFSIGIFINRIGRRLNMFLAGSLMVFLASMFITFVRKVPIMVSLIMMNFSGSMVPASIFSLMNLVIDNHEVAGAALGLIRSAEFASVTIMEMLNGILQDSDHNRYDTVLLSLAAFAGILLAVAIAVLAIDYKFNGGRLNSKNPYVTTSAEESRSSEFKDTGRNSDRKKLAVSKSLNTADSAVDTDSDSDTQKRVGHPAQMVVKIPRRRYLYLVFIGILLVTAWGLFILSLTRVKA
ncbi:hypothetical protein LPJ66_006567 [Kickxella alabastrina]|uniref:Uncharacterized protein n=1 Tax=Kickxella alabastrina TaxID=61397 RepID=A0ACC1IDP3_9FUNG|nr:hypothetical protein LPJ66_006567 [Kickxella alabastrina]